MKAVPTRYRMYCVRTVFFVGQHMEKNYCTIWKYINQHSRYRSECLNLIASENLMSPGAQAALATDLGNRYTVGQVNKRWYPGCAYYDQIEKMALSSAKKLFHAQYVNLQPTSGMVANMVAYYALLKPHDLIFSLQVKHSGHYSHGNTGILSLFDVRIEPIPFDEKNYSIDLEKTVKLIRRKRPNAIIVGTSEFLFPTPLRELRKVCDETETKIIYDAAHVSGLIAGQTFQNPLSEGADMLSMSTNKTLSAPSHGLVACNDKERFQSKVEHAIVPLFTSNHHPHHVAGLAITLSEFERYGHDYATQVIKNAQALAQELYNQGVYVLCPHKNFTQSHTVLFDAKCSGNETMRILEKANIIVNQFQLPWNNENNPTGIRIGTNEITRLGMKETEMRIIAKLIASVMLHKKKSETIRKEVIQIRHAYQTVHYCFNSFQNHIN